MTVRIIKNLMISSKQHHQPLSWDDGKLYCDMIDEIYNDWRMPTVKEVKILHNNYVIDSNCWTDAEYKSIAMYRKNTGICIWESRESLNYVIPVRTT